MWPRPKLGTRKVLSNSGLKESLVPWWLSTGSQWKETWEWGECGGLGMKWQEFMQDNTLGVWSVGLGSWLCHWWLHTPRQATSPLWARASCSAEVTWHYLSQRLRCRLTEIRYAKVQNTALACSTWLPNVSFLPFQITFLEFLDVFALGCTVEKGVFNYTL